MARQVFFSQQQGVAGVIEALLLVALVAVVISTIQLMYIPEIMEQREAEHMDTVENQFSYLKSVIDIQTAMDDDIFISSPITLGSRELPYFVTARAFGQLTIEDNPERYIQVDFVFDQRVPLSSIKYESMNSYYIDQIFVLSGGGLILDQAEGEAMRVNPSIKFINNSPGPNQIQMDWIIPSFYSIAGKNATAGFKNCYIRTNRTGEDKSSQYSGGFSVNDNIRIYTDYVSAWNQSLNKLASEYKIDSEIDITMYPSANPSYVEIKSTATSDLYIDLTIIKIGAQIGPGTVLQ